MSILEGLSFAPPGLVSRRLRVPTACAVGCILSPPFDRLRAGFRGCGHIIDGKLKPHPSGLGDAGRDASTAWDCPSDNPTSLSMTIFRRDTLEEQSRGGNPL